MKVKILSDTACDLSKEILKKYDIDIIPFTVVLGDKDFKDGKEIKPEELVDYVRNNKDFPKTTAPNQEEFKTFFAQHLNDDTEIVYIGLSGELSSAYANAKVAAEQFNGVYVVDSRSLSTGIGLLVVKACELAKQGKTAKEIAETIEGLTTKVQASFVVEKVDFLRKGGRCSMLAALGANLLKIKPVLILKEGKIVKDKMFFGKHSEVLKKYVKYILEQNPDFDDSLLFVTSSTESEEYAQIVKDLVKDIGFKKVEETNAGATISCHCGPGTIGILYLRK